MPRRTCILVTVFDRPHTLRHLLESLRRQGALDSVQVWQDGSFGHAALREKLESCRTVVRGYPEVRLVTRNGNFGINRLALEMLTAAIEEYERMIFMEDDCFPVRDAIKEFNEQLDEIEHRPEVFSVYGHHFLTPSEGETITRFQGWGFATTREKLRPILADLWRCYHMPEPEYLAWAERQITDEVRRRLDVTPGRDVLEVLRHFFSVDSCISLLTAAKGLVHKKTPRRTIYNCGMGPDSIHFPLNQRMRLPPFNMILPEEAWQFFDGDSEAPLPNVPPEPSAADRRENTAHRVFLPAFLTRSLQALGERPARNLDTLRFRHPFPQRFRRSAKRVLTRVGQKVGIAPITDGELSDAATGILRITNHHDKLERTLELLADDRSRKLLVEVMAYRAVGGEHMELSTNSDDYWRCVGSVRQFCVQESTYPAGRLGHLDLYRIKKAGHTLELHTHALGMLNTFLLEQYRYAHSEPPVEVSPGDVCIDAGACWGDTSLYLAAISGDTGRVFAFEFIPRNLEVFRKNIARNPAAGRSITLVPHALWDQSGLSMKFCDRGPGSSTFVTEGDALVDASTLTIDDLVAHEGISRVDFIKMDIEGAELRALRGAETTLRTHRPKLAIALYHRLEDFIEIPSYLDGLRLGYEFTLGHFTIHSEETVLFARPSKRMGKVAG